MNIDDIIASQRVDAGNANIAQNIGENADTYARDLGTANALGVSVDTYRQNVNAFNARISQEAIDLANAGPVMQEFFADRERQALIANEPDEYKRLGYLEGTFAAFKDGMDIGDVNDIQADLLRQRERVKDPVAAVMKDVANSDLDDETRAKFENSFRSIYFNSLQQDELREMSKQAQELALLMQRPVRVQAPKEVEEISNAKDWQSMRDAFLKDPLAVLGYTGGSSMGQQWLPLIASVPAYAMNKPLGALVASMGGGHMEYQASLREYAQEELGYDFTDPKQVMAFINNAEHLAAADKFASARHDGVVFWDFVAGLIAPLDFQLLTGSRALSRQIGRAITGRTTIPLKRNRVSNVISAIGAKSPYISKIDSILSQAIVGGVLGAAGEYTAQQNAGQETNWGDVFLEAVGEFFTMPVEAGFAHVGVAMNHIKQRQRAAIAAKVPQVIADLAKVAANSTLRSRSPEEFKATVEKMSGDGSLKEVYVKPGELGQSARAALAAISPEVAQAMEKAEAEGGVAKIPMADLLTALANDDTIVKDLANHVRVKQDGMSAVEATQWMKDNQNFLQRHFQEVYRAQVAKKEFREELKAALAPMSEQLKQAHRETIAKRYVANGIEEAEAIKESDKVTRQAMRLFEMQVANFAALSGMTPSQFVARFPNQVQTMLDTMQVAIEEDFNQHMATVVPGEKTVLAGNRPDTRYQPEWLNLAEVRRVAPDFFSNILRKLSGIEGLKSVMAKGETEDEKAKLAIDAMKQNLRWLWNLMPEEVRERAKLWYVGGRKFVEKMAHDYGISDMQAAAVIAVFSPQRDWFSNLTLAQRLCDIFYGTARNAVADKATIKEAKSYIDKKLASLKEYKQKLVDPSLAESKKAYQKKLLLESNRKKSKAKYDELIEQAPDAKARKELRAKRKAKDSEYESRIDALKESAKPYATAKSTYERTKRDYEAQVAAFNEIKNGKTFQQLVDEGNDFAAGMMFRAYNDAHNPVAYNVMTPEGLSGGPRTSNSGDEETTGFPGFDVIARAVSVLRDGSTENIYNALGSKHKVRSFYNNLYDPTNPHAVTIDTHATAAALLLPLAASDQEVKDNFGSINTTAGFSGTYAIYNEAYVQLAQELSKELGMTVLPREVQSVTWEVVRVFFTADFKGDESNKKFIRDIWKKVDAGEMTAEQAREAIKEKAMAYNGGEMRYAWQDVAKPDNMETAVAGDTYDRSDVVIDNRGKGNKQTTLTFAVNGQSLADFAKALDHYRQIVGSVTKVMISEPKIVETSNGKAVAVSMTDNAEVVRVACLLCSAMGVDSCNVTSLEPFEGAEKVKNFVSILPLGMSEKQTQEVVSAVYSKLNRPVFSHDGYLFHQVQEGDSVEAVFETIKAATNSDIGWSVVDQYTKKVKGTEYASLRNNRGTRSRLWSTLSANDGALRWLNRDSDQHAELVDELRRTEPQNFVALFGNDRAARAKGQERAAWWGRVHGQSYRCRTGHVGSASLPVTWSPDEKLRLVYELNGMACPDFVELPRTQESAKIFAEAISASKENNPHSAAVYVYSEAEYAEMRLFLSEDKSCGVAVKKNGDIVSVFNTGKTHRGVVHALLTLAIEAGGNHLDCFDTVLPKLYAPHGFRVVVRQKFNNEFQPEGWNKETFKAFNNGEPDVTYMSLDDSYYGAYRNTDGEVIDDYDETLKLHQEATEYLTLANAARYEDSRTGTERKLADAGGRSEGRAPAQEGRELNQLVSEKGVRPRRDTQNEKGMGRNVSQELNQIIGPVGAHLRALFGFKVKSVIGLYRAKSMLTRMRSEGKIDPHEIWIKTGWELGVDGKWRHEINDGQFKVDILKQPQGKEFRLPEVFDAPDLYAAYPNLRFYKIIFDDTLDSAGSTVGRTFTINIKAHEEYKNEAKLSESVEELVRQTVLHELQHGVQDTEGFAQGSSPWAHTRRFRQLMLQIGTSVNEIGGDWVYGRKHVENYFDTKASPEVVAKLDALIKELGYKDRYEFLINEMPAGQYWKVAGEVESRNVEFRSKMTPEERAQKMISETEDVAREDQIIVRDGIIEMTKSSLGNELLQAAWHGSPHTFDFFSLDFIGTGEGAQAHGWGLYFAKDRRVAEDYRGRLANDANQILEILGVTVDPDSQQEDLTGLGIAIDAIKWAMTLPDGSFDTSPITPNAISSIQAEAESMLEEYREDNTDLSEEIDEALEIIAKLKPEDIQYRTNGRVFKVDIPEDDVLLDEQKQFKDQPKHVQDALNRVVDNLIDEGVVDESFRDFIQNENGWGIYWSIGQKYDAKYGEDFDSLKAASLALNAEGIPGIAYEGRMDGRCFVIFDDKAIEILEYMQKQEGEQRRATYNPSERITRLFKMADESSFVHESAHYWLETMAELAREILARPADDRTPGEQAIIDTLDGFLKWLGQSGESAEARIQGWLAAPLDARRNMHEQFARGYEAYLRRGKAPTSGLRKVFEEFTTWLKRIYSDASELDVEMSDEVAALYDRLFMAEAEAESVKKDQHIISIFPSARAAGMSDEEFAALQEEYKAVQNAIEASIRANREKNHRMLRSRFEREKRNLQGEYEKLVNKHRKALEKDPVYLAWKVLTEPFEENGATFYNKLSLAEVRRTANEDTAIVDAIQAKGLITNIGQRFIPVQVLADMVGAKDAKQLLIDLADALPMEEEVVERAEAEFMQKYGNLPDDDGLGRAALMALAAHDPAFSNVLEKEYNALAKLTGGKRLVNEGARMYATKQVGEVPVKNLMPLAHARAEARAGQDAQKAFNDGDLVSAAIHKRNQVVQHHIARAGYEARAEIAKGLTYVKKVLRSKTIWGSYMEQIENLAARYRLANIEYNSQAKDLEKFIEEEEVGTDFDEFITNRKDPHFEVHYSELTVDEFREVIDTIKCLEKLGRDKDTVIKDGQRQKIAEVVGEINESIAKNATEQGRKLEQKWEKNVPSEQRRSGLLRFLYQHTKIAAFARVMDGDTYGALWNFLIRRANECGDKETEMRAKLTNVMREVLAPVIAMGGMHTDKVVLPGTNRPLTREERIAFALNWGNDGNRQRLKDGFNIEDQQAEVILRSLSEVEWRAVEKIWQVFETLRPQMEALEVRLYGRAPRWIEYGPFEVTTKEGRVIQVSGGYYPAVYDTDANERSQKHQDMKAAEGLMNKAVRAVATDRSHMKKRSEKVNRPISLRLSNAFDALNNEVHDICWREFVIDTQKVMNNGVAETISGYYDPDVRRQFRDWLSDIAMGDQRPREGIESMMSHIRQGVGLAGLGFNVVSAIAQLTGLAASATRLGSYVGVGVNQYVRNPIGITKEVCEASLFMKNRGLTRFRELNEVNALIRSADKKVEQYMDKMRNGGYLLLLKVQQVVDTVTWLGAYQQAIDNGESVEKARAMADQVVIDTQGSGMIKDLAAIERGGPAMKMLTVFYAFMNNAFNLNVTAFFGDRNRYRAAAKILTMSVVMPALEGLLRAAIPVVVGDDDDDDEITAKMLKAAGDVTSFNLGLLVGVRELQGLANAVSGGQVWNYSGPAGFRLFSDVYKATTQVMQWEFDAALVKSLVNLGGSMFGLPAAQINRAITAGVAYSEGEIDELEAMRGALFGVSMK